MYRELFQAWPSPMQLHFLLVFAEPMSSSKLLVSPKSVCASQQFIRERSPARLRGSEYYKFLGWGCGNNLYHEKEGIKGKAWKQLDMLERSLCIQPLFPCKQGQLKSASTARSQIISRLFLVSEAAMATDYWGIPQNRRQKPCSQNLCMNMQMENCFRHYLSNIGKQH